MRSAPAQLLAGRPQQADPEAAICDAIGRTIDELALAHPELFAYADTRETSRLQKLRLG